MKSLSLPSIKFQIPLKWIQYVYTVPLWQKLAVLAVALTVPLAIFIGLIFYPSWDEITVLNKAIGVLTEEVRYLEARKQTIPKLQDEVNAMEQILSDALLLLPEKKNVPSILSEISTLGNEVKMDFTEFKPENETIQQFYAEIPMTLKMHGAFYNTMLFFDKIAKMARIVNVKEVTLGGAKLAKEVMSQKASNVSSQFSNTTENASGSNGGSAELGVGGQYTLPDAYVLSADCKLMTYRFLSVAEITAHENARKESTKKKK